MRAVTLLYHDVVPEGRPDSSGRPGSGAARFKLPDPHFRAHLKVLAKARSGAPITIFQAQTAGKDEPAFLLTFDDGGVSAMRIADLLEEHGWKGHFFVTASCIGRAGYLEKRHLRELSARAHVVGSHSMTHPTRMSALTRQQLIEEWRTSSAALSDVLGEEVRVGSVPGGYFSREVARTAASVGYRALFTSEPTTRCQLVNGCTVLGRFSIWRSTSADAAGQLSTGFSLECWKQTFSWNAKKILKRIGGRHYPPFRRWILDRRKASRGGEQGSLSS